MQLCARFRSRPVKKILACEELAVRRTAEMLRVEKRTGHCIAASAKSEIMTIKRPLIHAGFCAVAKIAPLRRSIRPRIARAQCFATTLIEQHRAHALSSLTFR
jgi:hypothetical protein